MDENNTNVNEDVQSESAQQKLSFDELLKDPDYQREFDRKVAKATEKSKAKWQKEADEKRSEAEALAKMSEEEKHKHELSKIEAERSKAVAELNAYKLKDEAQKIAAEKGIDIALLDLIDYSTATAEDVKAKLDAIDAAVRKAVEKGVNEKLKQPSPKQMHSDSVSSEKAYLDRKYADNKFYKKN